MILCANESQSRRWCKVHERDGVGGVSVHCACVAVGGEMAFTAQFSRVVPKWCSRAPASSLCPHPVVERPHSLGFSPHPFHAGEFTVLKKTYAAFIMSISQMQNEHNTNINMCVYIIKSTHEYKDYSVFNAVTVSCFPLKPDSLIWQYHITVWLVGQW